jgi:hypothetical protein
MWLYRVCRRLHCGLRRRVPGVAGALLAGDWNARMRRSITSHHLPCAALALTIAARHLPPASAGDLQNYRPAYATLWRSPAASYLPADATTIMRGAAVAARLLASSWEKCIVRRSLSWWGRGPWLVGVGKRSRTYAQTRLGSQFTQGYTWLHLEFQGCNFFGL